MTVVLGRMCVRKRKLQLSFDTQEQDSKKNYRVSMVDFCHLELQNFGNS